MLVADELYDDQLGPGGQVLVVRPAGAEESEQSQSGRVSVQLAELRRRVTSPNGTTEAAIKSFQANGFEALVEQALNAASQRSAELAEQLGQ